MQPEPQFTCSFCASRQPLSQLVQVGTGALECLGREACWDRAQASGIYPRGEDELDLAAREARQGALR